MRKLLNGILAVCCFLSPLPVFAADFDGTKTLLCASVEAIDCSPGDECEKGLPDTIGAPQFMRIDFAKKEVIGPKRTTPILRMETSDDQITLYGFELGMGWTIALDRPTGKMTVALVKGENAFVIFGACTPLQ